MPPAGRRLAARDIRRYAHDHRLPVAQATMAASGRGRLLPALRAKDRRSPGYFKGTGCTDLICAHRAASAFRLPAAPFRQA
jgi:hypothetical protein